MQELVFHIGLPKTGSSALQVFLAKNYEALLNQSVDYFKIGDFNLGAAGQIGSGNGALLARALLGDDNPVRVNDGPYVVNAFLDRVQQSSARIGLVSGELLAEAAPAKLAQLIGKLNELGICPKINFFIRSQSQMLSAVYIQQVKRHSCTEDANTFIKANYRHIRYLRYFSYYESMTELFGKENVSVARYDEHVRTNGIFRQFIKQLGISEDGIDFAIQDVNTSLSQREVAIMLILNRLRPRMQFSDTVVLNSSTFGRSRSGVRHRILSRALEEEMQAYFENENRLLSERLFDGNDLFEADKFDSAHDEPVEPKLDIEDLIEFFGGLLVRYDHRIFRLEEQINSLTFANNRSSN